MRLLSCDVPFALWSAVFGRGAFRQGDVPVFVSCGVFNHSAQALAVIIPQATIYVGNLDPKIDEEASGVGELGAVGRLTLCE